MQVGGICGFPASREVSHHLDLSSKVTHLRDGPSPDHPEYSPNCCLRHHLASPNTLPTLGETRDISHEAEGGGQNSSLSPAPQELELSPLTSVGLATRGWRGLRGLAHPGQREAT